jgi:uncharacterized protein (TIGR00266 family)
VAWQRADTDAVKVQITHDPAYALAYVYMAVGESFLCERGAMAMMSEGIAVKGSLNGGVRRAVLRRFTDESAFMGEYTAEVHGAFVALAPKYPGDIKQVTVYPNHPLVVQSGSLLGHESTVDNGLKVNGLKAMIMHEGIAALRLRGNGIALICSYGGIEEFRLPQGQSIIVDTGHLVAWSESAQLDLGLLGGPVAASLTGEGVVARMTATEDDTVVYLQTRAEQNLKNWLAPERAQNTGGGLFRNSARG